MPINRSLVITDQEWKVYSRKMALIACSSFAAVELPVLFNLDNPGLNQRDGPWIVQQCPGALVKQGIGEDLAECALALDPAHHPTSNA